MVRDRPVVGGDNSRSLRAVCPPDVGGVESTFGQSGSGATPLVYHAERAKHVGGLHL